MGQDEKRRLDQLMGTALIDPAICDRLVHQRDTTLFMAFGISGETQKWLRSVEATSLAELAEAIVAHMHNDAGLLAAQPACA